MAIEHYLPDLVAQLTPSPSDDGGDSIPLQRMEDYELNIIEVYEQKRLIQGEFEKISEEYGAELTRGLLPRVACLIKLLETQVIRNEKCVDELLKMKQSLNKLKFDQHEVRELRKKHREELESIDSQWHAENESLHEQLTQLKKENQRLREDLQRRPSNSAASRETVALTREDLQAIQNLSEQNDKLNARLRSKDKEVKETSSALESMRKQLDDLSKTITTLKRQQTFSANQVKSLTQEKLELELQLKEKESFIQLMKERADRSNEENPDSSTPTLDPVEEPPADLGMFNLTGNHFSVDVIRQIIWEKIDVKQRLMHAEDELQVLHEQLLKLTTPPPAPAPVPPPPKRKPLWILFLLLPIILCFAVLRFWLGIFSRARKTTSLPMARRSSVAEVEHSTLPSPFVQAGVLMAKSSLPLRSPKASFSEN